jgi:hypothetical protein
MCCNFLTLELRFYKIGSKIYTGGIASTAGFAVKHGKNYHLPSSRILVLTTKVLGMTSKIGLNGVREWVERGSLGKWYGGDVFESAVDAIDYIRQNTVNYMT